MRKLPRNAAPVEPVSAPIDTKKLAKEMAPLVLAEMVAALGAAQASAYSDRKGHGPAELTETQWKAIAPQIPGGFRPPGGRWLVVPRRAYESWLEAQGTEIISAPSPVKSTEVAWSPESALVGLRAVGGGR